MSPRAFLAQITAAEFTELRAYHEMVRDAAHPERKEKPTQSTAEVEANTRALLSRPKR